MLRITGALVSTIAAGLIGGIISFVIMSILATSTPGDPQWILIVSLGFVLGVVLHLVGGAMSNYASRKKTKATDHKFTTEFDIAVYSLLKKEAKKLWEIEINQEELRAIYRDRSRREHYAARCKELLNVLSTFNIPHLGYPNLKQRESRTNWTNLLKTLTVSDTIARAREALLQTNT